MPTYVAPPFFVMEPRRHVLERRKNSSMESVDIKVVTDERNNISPHSMPKLPAIGDTEKGPGRTRALLLLSCFVGIFCSYFVYGLMQEKITKRTFDGERFNFFLSLVLVQCVINATVARIGGLYARIKFTLRPALLYGLLSFSYVGSMLASNTALAFITFPTQVLGKSAKPIPVLLLGVLIARKRYPALKYLSVLLIVLGVALFFYNNVSKVSGDQSTPHLLHLLGVGELLVLLSLLLDGVTAALQERVRQAATDVHALQMMHAVNVCAAVYLFIGVVVTGEGLGALRFVTAHSSILCYILLFGITSAVGQIFIFLTITQFGPLTCSIFTTTRKFFTILGSVLIFGNSLMTQQWLGVCLVFVGLGLDLTIGKAQPAKTSSSTQMQ